MADRRKETLEAGLAALDSSWPAGLADQLLAYLDLLQYWNRRFNLTGERDPQRLLSAHVLDCAAVSPHVQGGRLLDVGTGAGLPGLILAMARPQLHTVLLDSNGKKTRFCVQAKAELGLDNVEVVRARAESYSPQQAFDTVISRALTDAATFLSLTAHLCRPDGQWLLMKGADPGTELAEMGALGENARFIRLRVPGLQAVRHLVVIPATAETQRPDGPAAPATTSDD
ncbi:MAG: 16S rRNA (guanine(527)-N(7))-methyltransferase RsmG [Gammaproteobacteria bacterium]|nr:MAG: 16S rRNA (guanine(527)-N(7))-methyltransferase RsmG [Gammaproteobacteria bacterium]